MSHSHSQTPVPVASSTSVASSTNEAPRSAGGPAHSALFPDPAQKLAKAIFFVTAIPDANILPRILAPGAKMDFAPERVHADREMRETRGHRLLNVDLRYNNLTRQDAHLIEKNLRRIIGVLTVIALHEAE